MRQYAKTAAEWIAETGRWSAERWREESARRSELRRATRPLVRDARRAVAAARKADPEGKKAETHRAERELRKARRAVPDSLWLLATKVAAGVGVAAYVGLPRVPGQVWTWLAVALVAAVVGGAAWLAVAIARHQEPDGLEPTEEERALMGRLQPEHWAEHAEGRGLGGTLTGRPELTAAGIVVEVRLDGTWTAGKLRSAEDHVRSLLGCRTGLRMEIRAGDKGGWARLTLRTRSAADGDDLTWSPSATSFGVDTVTGDQVVVPLGERLLIAGRSGAGKSVASRPLLWLASEGETNSLVIIDLKKAEGRLWDHRARVASTPVAVVDVVDELVAEQTYRLDALPKGQATWTPTPEHPRLTVVVDEGAEAMTAAKDALEGLESLARMGRAACIDLWWMTQKPTIGDGIPKQIAPQMSTSVCLAVRTPAEARVVLGEDAQAKGWTAEELPAPGVALVRDGNRKPHPIRVRHMTDQQVIDLPAQPIWQRESAPAERPPLELVRHDVAEPEELEGSDARVMEAIRALRPPVRQVDIVAASGLPKGTVSKSVKRLTERGYLVREDGGTVAVVATGEVSA